MKSLIITYERTADGRTGQYELALQLNDVDAADRHTVQNVIARANGAVQQRDNRAVVISHRVVEAARLEEIMPDDLTDDQRRVAYATAAETTNGMAPSANEVARAAQGLVGDVGVTGPEASVSEVAAAVLAGTPISLDNPNILAGFDKAMDGVTLHSAAGGDTDGDGRVSLDEISVEGLSAPKSEWEIKAAANKAKAAAAFSAGVQAVEDILNGDVPFDLPLFIEQFSKANPYKMVGWGDVGVEVPSFQDGYNRRLAAHYGIPSFEGGYDDKPQDIRDAMNGRDSSGETFASIQDAERAAKALSKKYGVRLWPEDRGNNVSPRYAVIKGFYIGEPVSYGFNGDSYIAGRVTKFSGAAVAGLLGTRIITVSDGKTERTFWRRKMTGSWKHDGTWSLMHGFHMDTNPEF